MQFNIYSLGFAVCAVIIAYVLRLVYNNPRLAPYGEFKALLWLFLYANLCMFGAMSATNLNVVYVLHEMKFVCVVMVTPLIYVFCYKINGIKRKNYLRVYILLCAVPAITLLGVATNPLHHLFCSSYTGDLVGSQLYLAVVRGPLFMVHAVYGFGLSALTVVVQLIALRKLPRGHRVTSYFLIAGLCMNVAVTIYSAFGGAKYGDPGVLASSAFAIFMYVGMLMKPAIVLNAANRITVENMKGSTLFFDLDKTLIAANEAARHIFGLTHKNYGILTEHDFFTSKLGIDFTEQYEQPELNLGGRYFQVDDHQLTDTTGLVCGRAFVLTEVTVLRKAMNDMEHALNHDSLTGMLNHVALMRRLDEVLAPPVSFLAFGMRGMKIINSLLGYEYGDTVIKTAAKHILAACGSGVCARFAGDVFVAVLPDTGEERAKEVVADIQNRLGGDESFFVPIRLWVGSHTIKSRGELPERALTSAFDKLSHAKLMVFSDDMSLEILQHALTRAGILPLEKRELIIETCRLAGLSAGLSAEDMARLDVLSRVYDIGLVSCSKELLAQKGHFSNTQWAEYKLHVERGYQIARLSPATLHIAAELLAHHEQYDGMGYPNHLKGDGIPLLSRLLSAGIFLCDAMYDEGATRTEAQIKLKSFSGTRFDPEIVKIYDNATL